METLKQITSKLNLFTFSDIPKEYTQKQILNGSTFDYSEKANNDFVLPSEILNKYEHGLFWECRKQYKNDKPTEVELYYIEHSRILFLSPKGNLIRFVKDRNNKYSFSLDYSHYREVQNVSYYQREEARKKSGIVEPNYIGVFTDKKVNDWLNYCDQEAELNKQIVDSSNDKNQEIEKEIETFINSMPCEVSKWNNNTEIKTNLFKIVFTHDKKSQYLSKKIEFTGTLKDITKIENN